MKKLFVLSALLLLTACGSKLDGTYVQKSAYVTFKSNGKAYTNMSLGLGEVAYPYEMDGNKITVHLPNATPVWTLKEDGSIDAGILGTFTRK